ncbi:MAG: twin-arginine translocase subunit TatC [Thaumarchaeota archaeon]|nr:twin-arginine translocase subunit TatC [Nitrososphaerota archaeon]
MINKQAKPIIEHLGELRNRFVRIMISILVCTFALFMFSTRNISIDGRNIRIPYPDIYNNMASQIIIALQGIVLPEYVKLILTTPGQALSAQIYISLMCGVIISMPLILWELTGFIKPGLYKNEIKLLRNLLVPASLLFFIGAVFALFIMVPMTMEFLYRYGVSLQAETYITINEFVAFITFFMLAFGIAFQLPIIMWLSTKFGLISNTFWRDNWRYTLVLLVVIGAIITPDASGITMWLITIPMMVLYFIGYVASRNVSSERIVKT